MALMSTNSTIFIAPDQERSSSVHRAVYGISLAQRVSPGLTQADGENESGQDQQKQLDRCYFSLHYIQHL